MLIPTRSRTPSRGGGASQVSLSNKRGLTARQPRAHHFDGQQRAGAFSCREVWVADAPPAPSEAFNFVQTGIAGLVGGIVATAFGVSAPRQKVATLSNVSTAGASERQWIGGAYVVVYFLVGVAAVGTWVVNSDVTSVVVKNLASSFVGMVIPVVAGYFSK